ncbi:hypothetical protein M3J09_012562 [Ascochyta lentis]
MTKIPSGNNAAELATRSAAHGVLTPWNGIKSKTAASVELGAEASFG